MLQVLDSRTPICFHINLIETPEKELWDIAMANKRENPMVSVRAIDSLHSITNDIARIIDLAPYVAGGSSSTSKQYLSWPAKKECELIV